MLDKVVAIAERRAALAATVPVWTPRPLHALFDDAAARFPDRPMFTNEQGAWSHAAMRDWSLRLARGIVATGVRSGEHVALLMANYAEFVALKIAISRVGAVTIPINFNLRGDELAYVVAQSDAVMLLTMDRFRSNDYLADLDAFAPGWRVGELSGPASLRDVFVLPTGGPEPLGVRTIEDLSAIGDAHDAALPDVDPHAVCDILYTSGTTGRPKGVMLSHDMVLRAGYACALHRGFEDGRTIVHALPMYHVFGYSECLVAAAFVGGHIVSQLVFDAASFLDLAEAHRASDLACLPNMTIKLLDLARTRGFDDAALTSVYNSGGANPPGIWADIRALLRPAEITTAYGMSETAASTVCTLPEGDDAFLATSNGRYKMAGVAGDPAIDGLTAQYKVVDAATGLDLPFGETGELRVRGPVVTTGYYNKPDETAASFADGWFRTGDLGTLNADGYLTLTGRLKEAYRCGGEMVSPREIEALVEQHPRVALALAVGVPDPRMGEIGCLCIVAGPEGRPDAGELLAMCAAGLAGFKVPRHVLFLSADEVPMTSTGRPQKVRLVEIAARRIAEGNR